MEYYLNINYLDSKDQYIVVPMTYREEPIQSSLDNIELQGTSMVDEDEGEFKPI